MSDRIMQAEALAREAHKGQKYKGDFPYYTYHVLAIAERVIQAGYSEDYVIVALLHDVIEDSDKYTLEDIRTLFGEEIAQAVKEITKEKGTSYVQYIFNIKSDLAKVVKIYDAQFNLSENLSEGNLQRAKKYSRVLSTLLEG